MKKTYSKVLACTLSALVAVGTASLPITPVTAYAPKPSSTYIAATCISLNRSELTLGKGESYSLSATITPANTTSKALLWLTSNASVAYVDPNGKITAKAVGTSTITAITAGGKRASCVVTVKNAPSSVTISKSSLEVGVGESYKFYATIPDNTAACVRNYTSSNNNIVSFDSKGNMIAKRAGTAVVTVSVFNGKTSTCQVTVKAAPSSVTLNKKELYLGCGETFQFHASIPQNTAAYVREYTSANSNIVACDSKGNITAKKTGTTTITVKTFNGKTDTCTVHVMKAPEYVTVEQDYAELYAGDTFKIITHVSSGATSNVRTFSSSNSSVATVDSKGLVTAKNPGTATITVKTYNGKTTVVNINVMKLVTLTAYSTTDDILNSVKLTPVKTNSALLDDKIDGIFNRLFTKNMSNADKVRACYDYLATNVSYAYISYDYSAVSGCRYISNNDREIVLSAYSTLVKYRGNCYDYACTLAAMMQRLGYDAHVVHGLVGMSAGGYGNHYWVDTNINGRHYIFDAQVENNNLGWGGTVNHYFYCLRPESTSMYIYQETWSTENFRVY